MSTPKIILVGVWIASLAAMLFGTGSWIGTLGTDLVGFLVVAHLIECVVFRKELAEAPGSLGGHLLQTFLFVVVHMGEVREARERAGAEA